jgi:outer membrane biosynthesis protein TonB
MILRTALSGVLFLAGGCAATPPKDAPVVHVPGYCSEQHAMGPTYANADLQARIAERKTALPEDATPAAPTLLRRLEPGFPSCAAALGIEGSCYAVFDLTQDGRAANILPVCTSRVFESNVKASVSLWEFEPPGEGPHAAVISKIVFKLGDYDSRTGPADAGE